MRDPRLHRRKFLRYLAASPLLANRAWADAIGSLAAASGAAGSLETGPQQGGAPWQINAPEAARSVFDFEAVAATRIPPAHFGFLQTGVDGETTLRANREALAELYLNPRVLSGGSRPDMSLELFGKRWETPIVLAPAGSQRAFHPDGEVATARAAGKQRNLQILSTVSTTSLEEVNAAYGAPVWYQL